MGIGRREFIRLFGAGIAAASTNLSSAIAIHNNEYINRRLGIAFQKPAGWFFANVQEMGQIKAGQILALEDSHLAEYVVESTELPILSISKEPMSSKSDRFTPGVNIYLERLNDSRSIVPCRASLVDSIQEDVSFCESILRDFRLVSSPSKMFLSRCDAARYEASFMFEHKNLKPTRVRMISVAIEQGIASYSLRLYDSPWLGNDMTFDYTSFLDSVTIM